MMERIKITLTAEQARRFPMDLLGFIELDLTEMKREEVALENALNLTLTGENVKTPEELALLETTVRSMSPAAIVLYWTSVVKSDRVKSSNKRGSDLIRSIQKAVVPELIKVTSPLIESYKRHLRSKTAPRRDLRPNNDPNLDSSHIINGREYCSKHVMTTSTDRVLSPGSSFELLEFQRFPGGLFDGRIRCALGEEHKMFFFSDEVSPLNTPGNF